MKMVSKVREQSLKLMRRLKGHAAAAAAAGAGGQASSRTGRHRAGFRTGEEGNALVEMALILPALLAIITAICAFGVAFANEVTLTNAVGAGAQYLQLIRTSSTDPCADTLTAIKAAAPNLNSSSISLSFNLNGTTVTGSTCSGSQTNLAQGQPVTVTATYPCTLSIYRLPGAGFASACQLSAKVTEYEY